MPQALITSFYTSRKRGATNNIETIKSKIRHIEDNLVVKNEVLCKESIPDKYEKPTEVNNEIILPTPNKQNTPVTQEEINKKTVFSKKNNVTSIVNSSKEQCKDEVISTARKELSLGCIKKRLAGSSRLAEIKATAERLSKAIQQLKESSEKPNLKDFVSLEFEVPSSPQKSTLLPLDGSSARKSVPVSPLQQKHIISPRKVYVSPIKSPSKVPAYIRQSTETSSALLLPHHYRILDVLFRDLETLVSMYYNRGEKITFTKLKPALQEMIRRNFTENHLGQIKYLVPDFYNFEVKKIEKFNFSAHKDEYELVISPNFPHHIENMNGSVLLERRRYFYERLLNIVKQHHTKYLGSLDPPIEIAEDKITRWHPCFEIESLPDIESAKLPEIPTTEKISTSETVLARARDLFKSNTRIGRALERLGQAKTTINTTVKNETVNDKPKIEINTEQVPTSTINLTNPALRSLPTALLEKVKAKQAAKAIEAMTRSKEQEQKFMIYNRLPDLARTLRNIFVTERRNVLALNIILSKLDTTFMSKVSALDLKRDIKLLCDKMPKWVKVNEVKCVTYLKLDKNISMNKVVAKLESLANKYRA